MHHFVLFPQDLPLFLVAICNDRTFAVSLTMQLTVLEMYCVVSTSFFLSYIIRSAYPNLLKSRAGPFLLESPTSFIFV